MKGNFLFGIILLMVFFAMLTVSQNIHEYQSEDFDIYNFTESNLVWNSTKYNPLFEEGLKNYTDVDVAQLQTKRFSKILYKTVDWGGYVSFESVKGMIEFGYKHPEYDFRFLYNLTRGLMYLLIIVICLPLITPLLALLYLIYLGIKKVITLLLQ